MKLLWDSKMFWKTYLQIWPNEKKNWFYNLKICLGQLSKWFSEVGLRERHNFSLKARLREDIETNKAIGSNGAKEIKAVYPSKKVRILTHCNTGSLATAGYGTALGVILALFENNELDHAFCTETRPYNQESLISLRIKMMVRKSSFRVTNIVTVNNARFRFPMKGHSRFFHQFQDSILRIN